MQENILLKDGVQESTTRKDEAFKKEDINYHNSHVWEIQETLFYVKTKLAGKSLVKSLMLHWKDQ